MKENPSFVRETITTALFLHSMKDNPSFVETEKSDPRRLFLNARFEKSESITILTLARALRGELNLRIHGPHQPTQPVPSHRLHFRSFAPVPFAIFPPMFSCRVVVGVVSVSLAAHIGFWLWRSRPRQHLRAESGGNPELKPPETWGRVCVFGGWLRSFRADDRFGGWRSAVRWVNIDGLCHVSG
ncbi:hypothetical protein CC80DRAFT_310333 [Byssothecium circinans]|uniref:Uncharacterized protein n=1 Tax=Byssothecium circinans TaxID=147558 RepID=A0A6A5U720_9PLEO|nr:hypothetical protein CC80DRAFT_310333 [Byssothecium circinans]